MRAQDRVGREVRMMPAGWRDVLSAYSGRLALIELGIYLAACAILWPTTQSLLAEWADTEITTYTHGYLIALISVWLLLRNGASRENEVARAGKFAYLLTAATSIVWLIAVRAGIQSVHQLLLPVLIWLAIYSALGFGIARRCAFAVAFLYFAIPLWGEINELLQTATVVAVDLLLRTTSVVAYVDGNFVHLARGTFEIAGGCSGLHFFIVALAIAALYGEVNRDSVATRVKLLVLAVVTALITNWLRVYLIILAGYLTDMQHYLVRVEHYRFGWLVFAVAMVGFFLIARRLPASDADSLPALLQADPVPKWILPATVVSLLALALGPVWNAVTAQAPQPTIADGGLLPVNPGSWAGPAKPATDSWQPRFVGADRQQTAEYTQGSAAVQAYVAVYWSQRQDKELIRYDNSVLGTATPSVLSQARVGADAAANEVVVADEAGSPTVLWYFYQVGRHRTAVGLEAQMRYAVASLTADPISSVVALRARCVPDCNAARAALSDLLSAYDWSGIGAAP